VRCSPSIRWRSSSGRRCSARCRTVSAAGRCCSPRSEANIAIAQSAVADVDPAAERSRLFGYVYLSSSLAYVVGPLAGGKLADPGVVGWFGAPTPFLAVAVLLMGTLGLTAIAFRETHAPDPGAALGLGVAVRNVGAAFTRSRLRPLFAANFALYLATFGFFRDGWTRAGSPCGSARHSRSAWRR
jgi:DHA1 family tetracycline resistance protein-like MFS transporter